MDRKTGRRFLRFRFPFPHFCAQGRKTGHRFSSSGTHFCLFMEISWATHAGFFRQCLRFCVGCERRWWWLEILVGPLHLIGKDLGLLEGREVYGKREELILSYIHSNSDHNIFQHKTSPFLSSLKLLQHLWSLEELILEEGSHWRPSIARRRSSS